MELRSLKQDVVADPIPDVRKIVVFRGSPLGDVLLGIPAFRALRHAYPRAEITAIGLPPARPVLARYPQYIDRFLTFPGFPGFRDLPPDPHRALTFLAQAQAEHYDLALQLYGNGVFSNPFTMLLGARVTAGFVRAEDAPESMGLNRHLLFEANRHHTLRCLDLLATIGVPAQSAEMEFGVEPQEAGEVDDLLRTAGIKAGTRLIGVHPGGRFPDRRWLPDRFATAANQLVAESGATVVITGTQRDRQATEAVRSRLATAYVDMTGRLGLGQLGALYRRLTLLLVNDTGTAHLAYALGTPSVTVFGTSAPAEWGPLDQERHRIVVPPGVRYPVSPADADCIGSVTVTSVLEAAAGVLAEWSELQLTAEG